MILQETQNFTLTNVNRTLTKATSINLGVAIGLLQAFTVTYPNLMVTGLKFHHLYPLATTTVIQKAGFQTGFAVDSTTSMMQLYHCYLTNRTFHTSTHAKKQGALPKSALSKRKSKTKVGFELKSLEYNCFIT